MSIIEYPKYLNTRLKRFYKHDKSDYLTDFLINKYISIIDDPDKILKGIRIKKEINNYNKINNIIPDSIIETPVNASVNAPVNALVNVPNNTVIKKINVVNMLNNKSTKNVLRDNIKNYSKSSNSHVIIKNFNKQIKVNQQILELLVSPVLINYSNDLITRYNMNMLKCFNNIKQNIQNKKNTNIKIVNTIFDKKKKITVVNNNDNNNNNKKYNGPVKIKKQNYESVKKILSDNHTPRNLIMFDFKSLNTIQSETIEPAKHYIVKNNKKNTYTNLPFKNNSINNTTSRNNITLRNNTTSHNYNNRWRICNNFNKKNNYSNNDHSNNNKKHIYNITHTLHNKQIYNCCRIYRNNNYTTSINNTSIKATKTNNRNITTTIIKTNIKMFTSFFKPIRYSQSVRYNTNTGTNTSTNAGTNKINSTVSVNNTISINNNVSVNKNQFVIRIPNILKQNKIIHINKNKINNHKLNIRYQTSIKVKIT